MVYNLHIKQHKEIFPMTNAQILGDKLYQLRKDKGISQEELADKLGVSRQAISKWERGEALPDTDNLISIAKLYEVSLDQLVGNTNVVQEAPTTQPTDVVTVEVVGEDTTVVVENGKQTAPKKSWFVRFLSNLPYPIVVTVAFILWGCLAKDETGWQVGWTLYLTIPVYYSIVGCIRSKRLSAFNYPVFCTFAFCFCGMMWNLWHPMWVVFLTIPIFYSVAR